MSEAATEALINAGTNRQGARAQGDVRGLAELAELGYVGKDNGLTRKGSIARERAVTAMLAKAFG